MRGLSIYIDRNTHSIEDASTLESVETDIIALHEMDLRMSISGNSAKKLVNSYYKDYFHDW